MSGYRAACSAILLASCAASAPSGTPRIRASELCADIAGYGGREVWLTGAIDPRSMVLYRSSTTPCDRGACCTPGTYLWGFLCSGVAVVLIPATLDRAPTAEDDPSIENALVCQALSDGSPSGGACRPTDCGLSARPNVTDIVALRGTLATAAHDPSLWFVLADPELPPVFLFSVREVTLAPDVVEAGLGFVDASSPADTGP